MILPMENTEKTIFPGVGKYGIPAIKPNGKGRSETEITSSTYERARKRADKNLNKWFGRGMDK